MSETFLNGRVTLHAGDSLDILRGLPDASIDSCVTDPPYALTANKRGGTGIASLNPNSPAGRARISTGFMGKAWDTGERAFAIEFWGEVYRVLKPGAHVLAFGGTRTVHRLTCAIEDGGFEIRDMVAWVYGSGFPKSHNGPWGGTALKPALEPITFARKPLLGTVAANALAHGTGALNIDGCRVSTTDALGGGDQSASTKIKVEGWDRPWMQDEAAKAAHADRVNGNVAKAESLGRWPANLIHDGSDEVIAAFPDAPGQQRGVGPQHGEKPSINCYGDFGTREQFNPRGDSGSAARFFYAAKADSDDRLGSKHPTVKPLNLIQYLVRLVTPPGGVVLDCFAGTGTTGEAAFREGMRAVLIEREPEYQADIRRRMALCLAGSDERRRETIKAKAKPDDLSGTLFAPAPMAAE